jgi:hypothetical protein
MNIKRSHINEFHCIADSMNNLLERIREYCPEANVYFDESQWMLMKSQSHDDKDRFREDQVVASEIVWNSGGCGR